jgi:hypothetical protein
MRGVCLAVLALLLLGGVSASIPSARATSLPNCVEGNWTSYRVFFNGTLQTGDLGEQKPFGINVDTNGTMFVQLGSADTQVMTFLDNGTRVNSGDYLSNLYSYPTTQSFSALDSYALVGSGYPEVFKQGVPLANLTSRLYNRPYAISPDGQWVVYFSTFSNSQGNFTLWRANGTPPLNCYGSTTVNNYPVTPLNDEGNWSHWALTLSANYTENHFCNFVPSDGLVLQAAVASNGTISLTGNGEEYWYLSMTSNGSKISCGEEGAGIPQYSENGKYFATSSLGTYSAWLNPEDFNDQNQANLLIYKNGVPVQNFTQTTGIGYNNYGIVAMSPSGRYVLLANEIGGYASGIQVRLYTASGTAGLGACPSGDAVTGFNRFGGVICGKLPNGSSPVSCAFTLSSGLGYLCQTATTTTQTGSVTGTVQGNGGVPLPPSSVAYPLTGLAIGATITGVFVYRHVVKMRSTRARLGKSKGSFS